MTPVPDLIKFLEWEAKEADGCGEAKHGTGDKFREIITLLKLFYACATGSASQ